VKLGCLLFLLFHRLTAQGERGLTVLKRFARAQRGCVVLAVGTLLLASYTIPAGANSYSERQQQLEDLIRAKRNHLYSLNAQADTISGQIQQSDQRLAAIQRALDTVSAQLYEARAVLTQIEAKLDQVSAKLHDKNAQLEATLGELAFRQSVLNARVSSIYMGAPTAYSSAMTAAQDFADIVAANEFAATTVRADQDAIMKLQETKLALEVQRNSIAADQAELARQRNAAAAQAKKIANIVSLRGQVLGARAAEKAHQKYLLSQVKIGRAHV